MLSPGMLGSKDTTSMDRKKIFISSVQSEFSEERKALSDYLVFVFKVTFRKI